MTPDTDKLADTLDRTRQHLLSLRDASGCWRGRLSSSALSTATAAFALARCDLHAPLVAPALAWLRANQNADGGWGDTTQSPSNLSTTLLAWSALSLAGAGDPAAQRAAAYVQRQVGSTQPREIAAALTARYGDDRTFAVPILVMCALAGRLGEDAWGLIPPLPFEVAALPHGVLRLARLPVVSYAMPALIAIGQAVHAHAPSGSALARWLRLALAERTRRKLQRIQPASGGFLEAAPLTSFVMMSLASIGQAHHPVVARGAEFLAATVRPDGSWPIDTDLSTWVTTLSINALAADGSLCASLDQSQRAGLLRELLARQQKVRHLYTDAAPGGWAWTDLSGGVPDADDTAGALLAVANLWASLNPTAPIGKPPGRRDASGRLCDAPALGEILSAVDDGVRWLVRLQNRDGGIPTFCRGWGRLAFDRSSPDLTAHASSALAAWARVGRRGRRAAWRCRERLAKFLLWSQRPAGQWVPLWFGNELAPAGENPVYGTARVLMGLLAAPGAGHARRRGVGYLLAQQNDDGGWGPCRGVASSIEETAAAVDALCFVTLRPGEAGSAPALRARSLRAQVGPAADRGVRWLIERTDGGRAFSPSPIGLYFASLWYHEQVYPVALTASALARARAAMAAGS